MLGTVKKKLGEVLVAEGVLSREQIDRALSRQDAKGKKLGKVLIDMGLTTEEEIAASLCKQLGLGFERLRDRSPSEDVLGLLDKNFVTRNMIVPLQKTGDRLTVAVADPLNFKALDEAAFKTGLKVEPVISTEKDLVECIDRTYKINNIIEQMIKAFQIKDEVHFVALPQDEEVDVRKIFSVSNSSPAMKLLAVIFMDAFNKAANDIYIENTGAQVRLRYRIEGDLYNMISMPDSISDTLTYYLKLIANLDSANKKAAQSGKSEVLISGKAVELEVSTLPTLHGERVKIRLRYKDKAAPTFSELGTGPDTVERLRKAAGKGQGLFLFTGPRNSGKRSMMYAMLRELQADKKDIMAIEARIEKKLDGITQVKVAGPDIAYELARVRSQAPDVIMVDEFKDARTASTAFEIANSGSIVLASMQARSPADALSRLVNFGFEPWLIASNLVAITSQRLIRKVCTHCGETYSPDLRAVEGLGLEIPGRFYRGTGCKFCHRSGYRGHVGITEIVPISHALKKDILGRAGTERFAGTISSLNTKPLHILAWEQVMAGRTTVEEVLEKVEPEQWTVSLGGGGDEAETRPAAAIQKEKAAPPGKEPAVSDPDEELLPAGTDGSFNDTMRQKKILLAFANLGEQARIKKELVEKDFDVICCINGNDALKTIYAENPDVLVCDLALPGLDSLTAYKKLYDAKRKHLPVITISNSKENVYSEDEKLLRSDLQMKRPLDSSTVVHKINKLLQELGPQRDWKVM